MGSNNGGCKLCDEHEQRSIFFGASILAAFTENATLTYLCSMADGLSDSFKYTLVAGAVKGGALTIIANSPSPAGMAASRSYFDDEAVHPLG